MGELTGNADRCRHGNMGGQERRREEKRREENMGWTAETRRNGRKEGCLVPSVGAC